MTLPAETGTSFDNHGLLRGPNGTITLFRAVGDEASLDSPNDRRRSGARTLFHGVDGVYAGNTPESVSMYSLPGLISVELPDSIEVEDLRDVSNIRWAGRHILSAVNNQGPQTRDKLTIVRMTPPASFQARNYRHQSGDQLIPPSWVIVPPHIFADADKKVIDRNARGTV